MADIEADVEVALTPGAEPDKSSVSPTEAGTVPATESSPAPETEKQEPKPERTFTQAELDDIVTKRVAKEKRKLDAVRTEADLFKKMALERAQAEPRPQTEQTQQPAANDRPKLEQFKEYDDYIEAVADWKAEQKIAAFRTQLTQQNHQERTQNAENAAKSSHVEREAKAREKYEDYDEVTRNPSLPVSKAMAAAILHADNGPDLYYYLGNHPEEAERISRLNPPLAVMELGKIVSKIGTTPAPARPVSRAPAPINPVVAGGGAPPSEEPLATDPIKEWVEKRNRAEAKRLGLRMGR